MKFIGGLLTIALVGILVFLFLSSTVVRFDLITVKPAFWLFGLGIVFFIAGGWLASAEFPGGSFFAALGTGMLLLAGYKTIWPNTAAATSNAQVVADTESAKAINLGVAPRQIPCDKSTQPRPKFFDSVTGDPLIWVVFDKEIERFKCHNRPGFDSTTREPFIAVDGKLALAILAQDPIPTPSPEVTPSPTPLPTPPPPIPTPSLRELGTERIPGWPFPEPSPTPTPLQE